jgi:hypothetical protein
MANLRKTRHSTKDMEGDMLSQERFTQKCLEISPVVSQCLYCFNEDTKRVIRRQGKSKNKQYNGRKKKDKRTNNDLQSSTEKTVRTTRTKLKTIWLWHLGHKII